MSLGLIIAYAVHTFHSKMSYCNRPQPGARGDNHIVTKLKNEFNFIQFRNQT